MGAPSNLSFGLTGPAPAAQAPTTNLTFGPTTVFGATTQAAPTTAFSAPQSSSVTFGTAASTAIAQPPPPAFGASTAPTLNFGATPASTVTTGFGGLAAKPLGASSLTFGTPSNTSSIATVQPTLTFGGGAPVASVAPSTSFNFSAQPATIGGSGLTLVQHKELINAIVVVMFCVLFSDLEHCQLLQAHQQPYSMALVV